jgi:hypothetical protein
MSISFGGRLLEACAEMAKKVARILHRKGENVERASTEKDHKTAVAGIPP